MGDFIVARYTKSEWALIWDDWHHAAVISDLNPLTIIEASGISLGKGKAGKGTREGVVEYEFQKPRMIKKLDGKEINGNLWMQDSLVKIKWVKPVFPNPLREMDEKAKSWKEIKEISEDEARKRAVEYARNQKGDKFKLSLFKNRDTSATKWDENEWYCSLLIFKSYSRTVTNMYLEAYDPIAGFWVTPEDLVDSRRSKVYHSWTNEKFLAKK